MKRATKSIIDAIVCPEHKFVYGGVKYRVSDRPIPGGGAHMRTYFDWFYCERCLENKYVELNDSDDTYDKLKFNATPKRR